MRIPINKHTNSMPFLALSTLLVAYHEASAGNPVQPEPSLQAAYKNPQLDIDTRVDDLVARMDLAEKISQLYNDSPAIERLGVPAYDWWNEALHGVARAGKATVFPQAVGMAAMWDEAMMYEIATAISDEARAKHHYFVRNNAIFRYTGLTFWSPNINIFRDPRWGRGQETYGEDPFLTASLAIPFIRGLQGDHPKYLKTAAMAKHFAVHSGPEKSRHSDNYAATPKDLYETYLPAFGKAVKEADVESVMCAYNRVNDDPACGSDMLLKTVLRGQWGFKGHVVSDCGAIADFYAPEAHALVPAPAQAAAWALRSGTDLNCGTGRLSTYANLHFALQKQMVTLDEIDTAVKRLFKTRFKLGMFDPQSQVPFSRITMDVVGSEKHLALTQRAAEKSFVLLKNDGVLPLKKNTRVAVIGPNATNPTVLVGNYHGDPIKPVSPLQGIQNYAGVQNVSHAPGSSIAADQFGHYEVISPEYFFHENPQGKLSPGLMAAYFPASLKNGRENKPAIERIDANIDFYWPRSPLDNSVRDEFGVVWRGVLKPQNTGIYKFQSEAKILIDGKPVDNGLYLVANKAYEFSAERTFLRATWGHPIEPIVSVRWLNSSKNLVDDAVQAAQQADVILFTGGISADLEGEEMEVDIAGFDHGDRTHITLPQTQQELLTILSKLNKPMVLINFSGSAMALNWSNTHVNAILQAFYPGEATGAALARLLWGDVSPSGRLPITFYKGIEDLPDFKDYRMENRTYKYYMGDVLYPFGYGLSYTEFQYSDLKAPKHITTGEVLELAATVSNVGTFPSDEVVQLYVSMKKTGLQLPQRELKGFKRIHLSPGENKQVIFKLTARDLAYVNENGEAVPYNGALKISIGGGQPQALLKNQFVTHSINITQ